MTLSGQKREANPSSHHSIADLSEIVFCGPELSDKIGEVRTLVSNTCTSIAERQGADRFLSL
jgi:hypothetical protein